MKCPACGRDMFVTVNSFECPNILCDYEEEIEEIMMIRTLMQKLLGVNPDESATSYS
jgi:hypothetical protein